MIWYSLTFFISLAPASGQSFTLQLQKSPPNELCVLLRLTPTSSSFDMNTISRDSKSSDFSLVPVARSYTNFNWERVAGPYAHDLEIINCFSGSCSLDVPHLSDVEGTSKFVLMSLSHSLTSQEEVSRFFQMGSFLPGTMEVEVGVSAVGTTKTAGKLCLSRIDLLCSRSNFFSKREKSILVYKIS